ncbi:MAG: elongation factor G, partial [Clostridia bacterium]|nr:elongation factor G [Clostridia bacterium]
MAKFTSSQIRNICLVGHSGDGKTSFAEAMLYLAKVTDRLGKPAEGNTVCDFDPEEIKRGYSINTALASLEWNGTKINILDAPGMFGFAGEAKAAAFVAASTVIVVDAKSGCKVGTELAWEYSAGKPKAFFVNKVDDENSNFEGTFAGLREQFGQSVCPLLIPFNEGSGQVGFYNLITDEVFYCEKNGNRVETTVPANFTDKIEEYKIALNESLALTSEELMEKFLMEEPFTAEEKLHALNTGLLSGDIAPVFCGSAVALSGIRFFL